MWGYNWVVMKIGLRYSQPFTFAALRTSLGALVLFGLLAALRRPLRPQAIVLTCLVGLLQTTGFVGLMMWALANGGAARTTVLAYTMPFWLLLMAWVVLGERLGRVRWLALALAFGGLILVLSPWRLNGLFKGRGWSGQGRPDEMSSVPAASPRRKTTRSRCRSAHETGPPCPPLSLHAWRSASPTGAGPAWLMTATATRVLLAWTLRGGGVLRSSRVQRKRAPAAKALGPHIAASISGRNEDTKEELEAVLAESDWITCRPVRLAVDRGARSGENAPLGSGC